MRKIRDEEFREYIEYKEFMGERPGESKKNSKRRLSLNELDSVHAARGKDDFARFLKEIKERSEEE